METQDLRYTPDSVLKEFEGRYKELWPELIEDIKQEKERREKAGGRELVKDDKGSWRLPDDPYLKNIK